MIFEDTINYIDSLVYKGGKCGLDAERQLMGFLGNPEKALKFIHIAGTNGKGSTALMLSEILKEAGYKTGLYISPYITSFCERIQIDGECISEKAVVEYADKIIPYISQCTVAPVSFDFYTALAMLYFKDNNVDVVVLETGLGGTYDATNVIENPLVCVITTIDYDHCKILGNTMKEIAESKAGIIKKNSSVVFYGENDEALEVIKDRCIANNAKLIVPDFNKIKVKSDSLWGQVFELDNEEYEIHLLGEYQRKNASMVINTIKILCENGFVISEASIKEGLKKSKWPARFEVLYNCEGNSLVLDGSHNPQGFELTMKMIKQYYPGYHVIAVFGVMADKDTEKIIKELVFSSDEIYLGDWSYQRALKPDDICEIAQNYIKQKDSGCSIKKYASIDEAVNASLVELLNKKNRNTLVFVGGSLYLAGTFREYLICRLNRFRDGKPLGE